MSLRTSLGQLCLPPPLSTLLSPSLSTPLPEQHHRAQGDSVTEDISRPTVPPSLSLPFSPPPPPPLYPSPRAISLGAVLLRTSLGQLCLPPSLSTLLSPSLSTPLPEQNHRAQGDSVTEDISRPTVPPSPSLYPLSTPLPEQHHRAQGDSVTEDISRATVPPSPSLYPSLPLPLYPSPRAAS